MEGIMSGFKPGPRSQPLPPAPTHSDPFADSQGDAHNVRHKKKKRSHSHSHSHKDKDKVKKKKKKSIKVDLDSDEEGVHAGPSKGQREEEEEEHDELLSTDHEVSGHAFDRQENEEDDEAEHDDEAEADPEPTSLAPKSKSKGVGSILSAPAALFRFYNFKPGSQSEPADLSTLPPSSDDEHVEGGAAEEVDGAEVEGEVEGDQEMPGDTEMANAVILAALAQSQPQHGPSSRSNDQTVIDPDLLAETGAPSTSAESSKKKKKKRRAEDADGADGGDGVEGPGDVEAEGSAPKKRAKKKVVDGKEPAQQTRTKGTGTGTGKKGRKSEQLSDEELRQKLSTTEEVNEFLASKWIHISELQRMEQAGLITYKRGKFSEAEKAALRSYLDTFKVGNRLSEGEVTDILMGKGHKSKRGDYPKFWPELASQVPGRPVRYVKEAVKRLYDPRARKGAWTAEEDETLLRAYEENPNEWTKIALVVDRTEMDCRDRYKNELRERNQHNKGPWSAEETEALVEAVKKINTDLGVDPMSFEAPWDVVVQIMGGTRSRSRCRQKWQDMLANEKPVVVESRRYLFDRGRLINRLRELGYTHERDISWKDVAAPGWEGMNRNTLRSTWSRMLNKVENRDEKSFDDVLDEMERTFTEKEMVRLSKGVVAKTPALINDNDNDNDDEEEEGVGATSKLELGYLAQHA